MKQIEIQYAEAQAAIKLSIDIGRTGLGLNQKRHAMPYLRGSGRSAARGPRKQKARHPQREARFSAAIKKLRSALKRSQRGREEKRLKAAAGKFGRLRNKKSM
jgi:hypothetical protein